MNRREFWQATLAGSIALERSGGTEGDGSSGLVTRGVRHAKINLEHYESTIIAFSGSTENLRGPGLRRPITNFHQRSVFRDRGSWKLKGVPSMWEAEFLDGSQRISGTSRELRESINRFRLAAFSNFEGTHSVVVAWPNP